MNGPWTVSCFVKREGRWQRLTRTVDALPMPMPVEAGSLGERAERRLREVIHEMLGVTPEDSPRGELVTTDYVMPEWPGEPADR